MEESKYEDRQEVFVTPNKTRGNSKIAQDIGLSLADQKEIFVKSNIVYLMTGGKSSQVQLVEEDEHSFVTTLDRHLIPVQLDKEAEKEYVSAVASAAKKGEDPPPRKDCTKYCMNSTMSKMLLRSRDLKNEMPHIRAIFNSPMLIEVDGKLIEATTYHKPSGIWCCGEPTENMELSEAVEVINEIFQDFSFTSKSDRARAIYSLITPALHFSGALGRHRVPIEVTEANSSQAGKGYKNQINQAVYNTKIGKISFSDTDKGLGSAMESLSSLMISGRTFIMLDNIRGRINESKLESLATEDMFLARKLHCDAELDPRDYYISMTSNSAIMTQDLVNRSCINRIKRQPDDYVYATFPEGDIVDHITANPSRYLGAIFTILRFWHEQGKPETKCKHNMQTFAKWAAVGNWIMNEVFGLGVDLLEDYDLISRRISSETLSYLRICANMVECAQKTREIFSGHDIACTAIGTSDFEDQLGINVDDDNIGKHISKKLAAAFKRPRLSQGLSETEDALLQIEGFWVVQSSEFVDATHDHHAYHKKMYAFYTDDEFAQYYNKKPVQGTLDEETPF
jgi:hypothetical protein